MGVFKDAAALYECLGTLFDTVAQDKEIGPKLGSAGLIIRFAYTEPDAMITVDTKTTPADKSRYFTIHHGPCDLKPEVLMTMKADIGHTFWLGKVNLLWALARRQIVAEGPIPKILKLLPIITPTYKLYPEILKKIGKGDLISA